MKRRYILYRRKRGGMFYIEDTETRKQESTGTRNRAEATSLLNARNESIRQPHLNLQIAKAYLAGTDSGVATRTWQQALDAIIETKSGSTQDRWRQAAKQAALDLIRHRVILETQGEHLLACLKAGTVSTNVHLRKLHNFCLSMNWLPWPIIPKRLWPEVRFKERRAITSEEHQLIIEREKNPERRSFYELCWHLGGSQTDIANLKAEDIDWPNQTIAYTRQKTGSLAMIHFGPDIEALLRQMPATGPLFPYLQSVRCGDRATEIHQRCHGAGNQRAFRCTPTATLGRSGRKCAATRSGLHKKPSDTTARPFTVPTPAKRKSDCLRWKATKSKTWKAALFRCSRPCQSPKPMVTRFRRLVKCPAF